MAHFEKHFTLAEANAKIAWIRALFPRIHYLLEQGNQPGGAGANSPSGSGQGGHGHGNGNGHGKPEGATEAPSTGKTMDPVIPTEVAAAVANLEPEERMTLVRGLLQTIMDEGILIQDVSRGLIDFPSWNAGEEILLCYELSDGREIGFWHELQSGYAGRRPVSELEAMGP